MLKELKHIIFDMDGTLIDSGTAIANAINAVRKEFYLKPLEKDSLLEKMNDPNINGPKYFYNVSHFSAEHSKIFRKYYDTNCIIDMTIYDGIKDLLSFLHSQNITMSIATNATTYYAEKMIKHLDIDNYFKLIVGSDLVTEAKPSADMILFTLKKLSIEKENVVLIGDSLKDMQAAKNSNIDSILVNWGFSYHENAINDVASLQKKLTRLL